MSYRDTILADSPVGYWRLGESAGTSANDETAANNDGTYVSGYTLGETGAINDGDKAVLFSSGYMTIPYTAALQLTDGPLSIEFWCKLTSLNAAEAKIIDIVGSGAYQITTDGSGGYALNKAGLAPVITLDTTVTAGTWHHIVFTKNATAMHGYLDGVEHSGTPANATLTNATGPLVLAKHRSSASDYLPGTLDEVAIYNTVLSLTQVAAHYAAATASPPSSAYATAVLADSPLNYYRCDAASGTAETDLGSLAKTGGYGGGFTLNQTGALAGDTDKACALNGTTLSRLQIGAGTQIALGDVFSIEVWIKPANVTTAGYLFSESGTGNAPRMWMADGTPRIYIGGLTSGVIATNQTDLVVGTWYHVVWTKSGATNHLYVNGVDDIGTVTNATIETPTGGGDAFWGIGPDGVNTSYNGTLDEVAVYNTALSSARVVAHHDAGTGSSSPDREGSFVLTTATYATGYSIPPVPANLADHTWTLQQACTNMGTGAAFGVPAYTYSETVTPLQNQRLVGYPGAIIDGGGTRAQGLILANSGTIIDGFEIRNHIPALQDGAVRVNAADCQLLNTRIHDNTGPGIRFASTNALVQDCELDHNIEEGWCTSGASCSGLVMRRVHGHHNNEPVAYNYGGTHTIPIPLRPGWYWPCDPFWEAGVGKVTRAGPFLFEDCEINNNGGVGIWGDITADDFTVRNCRVYENDLAGIMFEISDGAVIEDNDVWSNGKLDHRGWAFDANILVSSALNATVQRNIIAHGKAGISIATQNRADKPANSGSSIHLYDNVVCMPAKQIGWYDDWGGGWPGRIESGNVIYPSQTAERDAILNAHNIPLTEGGSAFADAFNLAAATGVIAAGYRLASHNAAIATATSTTFTAKKAANASVALGTAIGLTFQGEGPSAPETAQATLRAFVDWNADDDFGETYEEVTDRVLSATWTRGRSSDFTGEAQGSATIVLRNDDDRYTPGVSAVISANQLVPGRPVRLSGTYLSVEYPQFYGYIERLSYNPKGHTCTIVAYDPLRRFSEVTVSVCSPVVHRTIRDMRREALEGLERGDRNLMPNPSFETDMAGWDAGGGSSTLVRITSDYAPVGGSAACLEFTPTPVYLSTLYGYPYLLARPTISTVYQFSVYLRSTTGDSKWMLGLSNYTYTNHTERLITVTPQWQRFSVQHRVGVVGPIYGFLRAATDGNPAIRVDCASLTIGERLYSYSDQGTTGRWLNLVDNESLDAADTTGWKNGWKNLVGNPSFETDTTGWSTAALSPWHSGLIGGGTFTRSNAQAAQGSWSGRLFTDTYSGPPQGVHYTITYPFKANHHYDYHFRTYLAGLNFSGIAYVGVGSDVIQINLTTPNAWATSQGTWTPTADHSEAHIILTSYASNQGWYGYIDEVSLVDRDVNDLYMPARYAMVGPNGGLVPPTSIGTGTTAKYGARALEIVTPATAKAGAVYDFSITSAAFVVGRSYVYSAWVRVPSGTASIRVGMAAVKTDLTMDEAGTTNASVGQTWVQITGTWTPTQTYALDSTMPRLASLYVDQEDATARTIQVDGIRVIPGASADNFEQSWWILANEADPYTEQLLLSGTVGSVLNTLNGLALSRHWIVPTLTSPWYEYHVEDRDGLVARSIAETYHEDISDLTVADIDRASILNVIPVEVGSAVNYYADEPSILAYGPRPSDSIGSSRLASDTVADSLGAALLARRKNPHSRPTVVIDNRLPSQLQREVGDVIQITMNRRGIVAARYNIQTLRTTVDLAGRRWHTEYTVEEHPF